MKSDYIQCAFCDWKTKRFYTNKKGKKRSGFPLLARHVYWEHPAKFEEIEEWLQKEESDESS